MIYDSGSGEFRNWIVKEEICPEEHPEKTESIMCLGNGYMCQRASNEDYYHRDKMSRFNIVAGTFDHMEGDEATELVCNVDVTNMDITVDGERLTPEPGSVCEDYEKTLNLRTGLLRRSYKWTSSAGKRVFAEFLRVVSLKDRHLMAAKVNITADSDCEISVTSGIDGFVHHSEHFEPLENSADGGVLRVAAVTRESGIYFSTMTTHRFEINGDAADTPASIEGDGKLTVKASASFDLKAGDTLSITKISNVFTSRDKSRDGCSLDTLKRDAFAHMEISRTRTFEDIADESAKEWNKRIWSKRDVAVESENEFDQLAIRFAIYHLTIMAPVFDNRMNIGAKGLSGPGYRGHTFWDTEIFMLPYFIFTAPDEAKSLIEYRYNCLDAARRRAKERGFDGAMFPWEAAWITDGETTPPQYLTGQIEYHITADVAVGVYSYYVVTGDEEFMEKYGYELLFETAKFWASRLEYKEDRARYEITDVIGPDEYKERVDNNAYTNYLAQYNIQLAIRYAHHLKNDRPEIYERLNTKCALEKALADFESKVDRIYLPKENEDGLVPQDDTYLSLVDIIPQFPEGTTLSDDPHKSHDVCWKNGGLPKVMMSKQADVMLLMYLFEDHFTPEIKKKNFYFYEKRCIHDSSLSLSTYSALAADLGEKETAYRLYSRAERIDLGPVMWSSHAGIHAASLGGIWQCVVFGFMGVRRYGEELRIEPHLPDEWRSACAHIYWHGQRLEITVKKEKFTVKNLTGTDDVTILHKGEHYNIGDGLSVCL
ncbi:MAG: glycoside hydrolase family 65 protein [Clostridia bacterium]|nr:glycoside hydrolase family 65 protein [Clostridia bacterium]